MSSTTLQVTTPTNLIDYAIGELRGRGRDINPKAIFDQLNSWFQEDLDVDALSGTPGLAIVTLKAMVEVLEANPADIIPDF